MGKIRFSSKKESSIPQYIEFKYHYYDEVSNETYLGLTSLTLKLILINVT